MKSPDVSKGLEAYWMAPAEVRPLILDQAEKQMGARITLAVALEARVTQVTALLFAGAAVAAQFTADILDKPGLAAALAVGGAISFALGGVIGFWGVFAGSLQVPGAKPSEWARGALDDANAETAMYWIAGWQEGALITLAQQVKRRSSALNLALVAGAAGGVLLAISALQLVIGKV